MSQLARASSLCYGSKKIPGYVRVEGVGYKSILVTGFVCHLVEVSIHQTVQRNRLKVRVLVCPGVRASHNAARESNGSPGTIYLGSGGLGSAFLLRPHPQTTPPPSQIKYWCTFNELLAEVFIIQMIRSVLAAAVMTTPLFGSYLSSLEIIN
ncbi:hypothetical protein J6590_028862 [Homalodisca vitripennis]|nr:hypothetical protein J6590_028862 [Homalodisca vitripennis]